MAGVIRRAAYEAGRAVREIASAIDRIGLRALEKPIFKEPFARHRPVMNLYEKHPRVSTDAFVAPNAAVIGDVEINTRSSVWYGAVVRGDLNSVTIGAFTSVGDRACIHTTKSVEGHVAPSVRIGNYVSIGAGAQLQSCTVEDHAVVGAGAVLCEGALVEKGARVGYGAVVHAGRRIPAGQVWAGNPAVYVRDASKTELAEAEGHATDVSDLGDAHAAEFLPYNTAYKHAEALGVVDKHVAAINAAQQQYEAALRAGGKKTAALA